MVDRPITPGPEVIQQGSLPSDSSAAHPTRPGPRETRSEHARDPWNLAVD